MLPSSVVLSPASSGGSLSHRVGYDSRREERELICPKCGAKYPRGFSECTHCDVRLVAETPAAPAPPEVPEPIAPGEAVAGGAALWCPECGAEYRQGVADCADCEVPLGHQPPAPPEHPEPHRVALTEISEPAVLPIVVGMLQSAGIETTVEGDEIVGLWPVGRPISGWTDSGRGLSAVVWVAADRADEARALLAEAEERSAGEEE